MIFVAAGGSIKAENASLGIDCTVFVAASLQDTGKMNDLIKFD
jgi:hypothetical protein